MSSQKVGRELDSAIVVVIFEFFGRFGIVYVGKLGKLAANWRKPCGVLRKVLWKYCRFLNNLLLFNCLTNWLWTKLRCITGVSGHALWLDLTWNHKYLLDWGENRRDNMSIYILFSSLVMSGRTLFKWFEIEKEIDHFCLPL